MRSRYTARSRHTAPHSGRYAAGELRRGRDGRWLSLAHHTDFSHAERDAALARMNGALRGARTELATAERLFVTLGTAWCFEHHGGEEATAAAGGGGDAAAQVPPSPPFAVANCHRLPSREFTRRLAAVSESADALVRALSAWRAANPRLRVTLTVSPVRHWKDGPVENSRSKAALLLAAHEVVERLNDDARREAASAGASATATGGGGGGGPVASYFPAYEILMDDLRDYRFYERDMLHPSPEALDYVWARLRAAHFHGAATGVTLRKVGALARDAAHRPHVPADEYAALAPDHPIVRAQRAFAARALAQAAELEALGLDVTSERRHFESVLAAHDGGGGSDDDGASRRDDHGNDRQWKL